MGSWVTSLIESATLGIGILLLTFGLTLLARLRRQGGLEMALAHMIADPRHRGVFLLGLVISLAALFGIGLSAGLEILAGTSADVASDVQTVLFGFGAAGMLILMVNALRAPSPSLQAGWILEEAAGRMTNAATPVSPGSVTAMVPGPPARRPGRRRKMA